MFSMKKRLRRILFLLFLLFLSIVASLALYIHSVNQLIDERILQLHLSRSSRFYALYPPFQTGQRFNKKELALLLQDQGYSERKWTDDLLPGEYAWQTGKPPILVLH